jgi:hypothetical protein
VNIPQQSQSATVVRDNKVYPMSVSSPDDAVLSYNLHVYDTAPQVIKNIDQIQTAYDRRSAILETHTMELRDRLATDLLVDWTLDLPASNIVRTSGVAALGTATGATGNRKIVTRDDIADLARIMDNQKIPRTGRVLVMSPDMYYQLFKDTSLINVQVMGQVSVPDNTLPPIHGFAIMVRGDLPVFSNAGTPAVKGLNDKGLYTSASSDNLACIAWHRSFVSKAQGQIETFFTVGDAAYKGDIFSAQVIFGGSRLRLDSKGILALVQAAAS